MDNAPRCPQPTQPQPKQPEIRPNIEPLRLPIRRMSHRKECCRTVLAIERMCANGTGYLAFYNRKRPHSSLNGRTPDQAYFCGRALAEAA